MRRRTVSADVAASIASWIIDTPASVRTPRSYSADGQERRAHPYALSAERQRGRDLPAGADAAGGEHRGPTVKGVNDLRPQHHRADLTGVPACLVALRDDDVHAVLDVALRVFGAARQRGHRNTRRVDLVDDILRRRAERVGDQLDRMLERHLDV